MEVTMEKIGGLMVMLGYYLNSGSRELWAWLRHARLVS